MTKLAINGGPPWRNTLDDDWIMAQFTNGLCLVQKYKINASLTNERKAE